MQETHLGRMAVDYGLIDEATLCRCLELQERNTEGRALGEILVSEGCLTGAVLRRLLSAQQRLFELSELAGDDVEVGNIDARLDGAGLVDYLGVLAELGGGRLRLFPGARPLIEQAGRRAALIDRSMIDDEVGWILRAALHEDELATLNERGSWDGPREFEGLGRFALHAFQTRAGYGLVVESLGRTPPVLEELGLPEIVQTVPAMRQGLVLVTGPRSSGKSTTLSALVQAINVRRRCHIVTLERPITYRFQSDRALIAQREIGRDVRSCTEGIRSCLREDPDVLLVGEVSDPEQIAMALTAAETGHLVLAGMRTRSVLGTLMRIIDACPSRRRPQVRNMLAALLKLVICQQLIPGAEAHGPSLATEVLLNTPAVANLIREERAHQIPQLMELNRASGMMLMDDSLARLVEEGRIGIGDALSRAADVARVNEAGRRKPGGGSRDGGKSGGRSPGSKASKHRDSGKTAGLAREEEAE